MRPLAVSRELWARMARSSTLRAVGKTYSVPSKLRDEVVRAPLYATELGMDFTGEIVVCPPRLCGHKTHCIGCRHVTHSLVRKPDAFRRYVYQEALFPLIVSRRTEVTLPTFMAARPRAGSGRGSAPC